jgi:hypothetical protein
VLFELFLRRHSGSLDESVALTAGRIIDNNS